MTGQMILFDVPVFTEDEEVKLCPGCGEIKPLSYYYRRVRNPDGYGYQCANCENPKRRTYGPVQRVDQPQGKKKKPRGREDYKLCMALQSMKSRAIKRDKMCRACGSRQSLEVHHVSLQAEVQANLDYVTAFCPVCHKKFHGVK